MEVPAVQTLASGMWLVAHFVRRKRAVDILAFPRRQRREIVSAIAWRKLLELVSERKRTDSRTMVRRPMNRHCLDRVAAVAVVDDLDRDVGAAVSRRSFRFVAAWPTAAD